LRKYPIQHRVGVGQQTEEPSQLVGRKRNGAAANEPWWIPSF